MLTPDMLLTIAQAQLKAKQSVRVKYIQRYDGDHL